MYAKSIFIQMIPVSNHNSYYNTSGVSISNKM